MKHSCFMILMIITLFITTGCKVEEPVRFAIIPDMQSFFETDFETDPNQLYKVFNWVKDDKNDIDFMIQVGDITEDNNEKTWEFVKDLFHSLDGEIVYTYALGNHDMGSKERKRADTRNTELANEYLDLKNLSSSGLIESYPKNKVDNLAHVVQLKGKDYLILSLEFGPRAQTVAWANNIIASYPNHKIIINTHAYMYSDSTRIGKGDSWNPHKYGLNNDGEVLYDGEELWSELIQKHNNIFMVVSGHILNGGVGTLVSTGDNGNKVCQMLANYQYGVKGMGKGIAGYIRIINYFPVSNKIEVTTYSPILDKFLTNEANQFTINLN